MDIPEIVIFYRKITLAEVGIPVPERLISQLSSTWATMRFSHLSKALALFVFSVFGSVTVSIPLSEKQCRPMVSSLLPFRKFTHFNSAHWQKALSPSTCSVDGRVICFILVLLNIPSGLF